MLVLLLLLEVRIEIADVRVKLLLVVLMSNLLYRYLLSNFLDSSVKPNSLSLRFAMSVKMLLDVKSVIVNDGAFGIQGNDGCLQSFDFNFLVGNSHLASVELLLDNQIWLELSVGNGGSFWSGLVWRPDG